MNEGAEPRGRDPLLEAVGAVVDDLERNLESTRLAIEQAREIQELRGQGHTYREILEATDRPLVVELITANLERLHDSGSALRQLYAEALHNEGLTMEQIAELFGVTRQRISALLRGGAQRDG